MIAIALVAVVPALAAPARGTTLCDFPGHKTWTRDDGQQVQSAAWLEEVAIIDVHRNPPTITEVYPVLDAPRVITTAAGNIIRAEGYVCNTVPGTFWEYGFNYHFKDRGSQPTWDSRDTVLFTDANLNQDLEVGTYFQQVGQDAEYTITPYLVFEDQNIAEGPQLRVLASSGSIPSADVRGPPGGTCGSLLPGQYSAQIAQNGDVDRGVWDNEKRAGIQKLSFNTLRNRIRIDLVKGRNTPPHFRVGDPVTIEGANPSGYDGTWKVMDVHKTDWIETTGPDRSTLNNGWGGFVTRYYKSGEDLPKGIGLAGYVEICVGTAGMYYATEKFEPTPQVPPMKTVRWESESLYPVSIPANVPARMRWYQQMPCKELGNLKMWPRVVQTPGDFPDSNILAEGVPFLFHVVKEARNGECNQKGGGGLPGPLGH